MKAQLRKLNAWMLAYVREYWLIMLLMGAALTCLAWEFKLSMLATGAIGALIGGACDIITQTRRPA